MARSAAAPNSGGAAALLAPSRFVHDWYAAHGAPRAQLITVRWGIMPPTEGLAPREPSAGPLRLLYVGGLAPNKGVHVAIEALKGIRGDIRLTVAGDESKHPDYVAGLRAQAGETVRFAGTLGRRQVWEALARADVVVVPSLWHETFCLVAHEAMAAGAVIFASRMGALTEAVDHERNGLLLPPGNVGVWRAAFQRAADDRAALEAWRANLPHVRQFDEHADEVERCYQAALEGSRSDGQGAFVERPA